MESVHEAAGRERDGASDSPDRGDRYQTSRINESGLLLLLLPDPWKPHRRPRAAVKECVSKLTCCLASVCELQWFGFVALGIVMATLSFLMDLSVSKLLRAHLWLYLQLEGSTLLQFACWTLYPSCLCAVASLFSHNICPFSTGSGVPEVRTLLSGIDLPHYLSLTNMFAKFLGLICSLAAGTTVFLGKVGPFVHLSTMMGAYLSKLCTPDKDNNKDKATGAMLVVSSAVGVASCFGAPICGVLFSVEVMSSHFAMRHYLPCFCSAAAGALTFHLFSVWSGEGETLQALFRTHFSSASPFFPLEMLLFAFLGLLCGAVSCCFLSLHRWVLRFTQNNPVFVRMLTTDRKGVYSGAVAFLLACVTFPPSAGRYLASQCTMKQLLTSLLDNRTWSSQSHNASVHLQPEPGAEWSPAGAEWSPAGAEWSPAGASVFLSLGVFLLMKMWMLVLACTLPLPAGYFMPVFVYGAALGRLLGEGAANVFSTASINPGGYALTGAAALSGAVTHTLSPALLTVELTVQFSHALPTLLATLLANALARAGHRPSFYDAISISKRLPHLPSLKKACPRLSTMTIGQFLRGEPVHLHTAGGPAEIRHAVRTCSRSHIPVVDAHEILLGFALRSELLSFLRRPDSQTLDKHLEEICSIHPTSVLLSPHNTVQQAHSVLSVVGDQTLFVVERGRLVGSLTWAQMKTILNDLAKDI